MYLVSLDLFLVSCICCLCSFSWTNFENGSFFLYYSYNLYETIFQSFNRCMWSGRPAAASEVRPGGALSIMQRRVRVASRFPPLGLLHCQSGRHIRYAAQSCFSLFFCAGILNMQHTHKHTHTHTLATLINIERLHSTTFDTWVRARRRRRGGEVICPVPTPEFTLGCRLQLLNCLISCTLVEHSTIKDRGRSPPSCPY